MILVSKKGIVVEHPKFSIFPILDQTNLYYFESFLYQFGSFFYHFYITAVHFQTY